jgi:hypothetical protein
MRNSLISLSVLSVFFISSAPVSALPPTESAHGILVKFRNASKSTFRSREQLHSQMKTRLAYRPKRSPYDFVVPSDENGQHDLAVLAQLCESYRTAPIVADCEINYDMFTRSEKSAALASAQSDTTAPDCAIVASNGAPLEKEGTLSPFWAQDFAGLDLVAFPRNATRMGVGVRVALIDQDFGPLALPGKRSAPLKSRAALTPLHGALTQGLITGPLPFTLQAPVEISHQFEVFNTVDYLKVFDTIEESARRPGVIAIGVGFANSSRAVNEILQKLSEKSILVAAAGNDWPSAHSESLPPFPGILVGSLSPEAYPSASLSEQPELTVSAGSDRFLQSTVDGKKPVPFGGSSGASAMVASAVAAAKSLVPDLQTNEVKWILEQVSLPTPASRNGEKGFSAFNAVKFLAVADRLRAEGLTGKQREKQLKLPNGRLYRFDKDAEMELARSLPVLENKKAPCDTRRTALNQLRRAYFLSQKPETLNALLTVYNTQGLKSNAHFLESQLPDRVLPLLLSDIESADLTVRTSAGRVAIRLGAQGLDVLMKLAESAGRAPASESENSASSSLDLLKTLASKLSEADRKLLQGHLRNHRSSEIKKLAEQIAP